MSKAAQNPREKDVSAVVQALSPWQWRPIWQGLVVAVLGVSAAVYGTFVTSHARAERRGLDTLREGLSLLVIERDVSVAAHDAIAAVTMQMYAAGREEEVEASLTMLRERVGLASRQLASERPCASWRVIHEDMTVAATGFLEAYDQPRNGEQTLAWLDEFLYDFKRVVPTDNAGRWTALLEVTTWAQEAPLVFRSYLDGAMAREWSTEGRAPVDEALIEDLQSQLNDMRRLRGSHGEGARSYSLFEEYILPDEARRADSTALAIVSRLASHEGVVQVDSDTPYLLALTNQHRFASVEELYADRARWSLEVARIANELLLHAQGELDDASLARARVEDLGRALVIFAVMSALICAARIIRRRLRLDAAVRTALERDVLTGLFNRYALFSLAPSMLRDPRRTSFALILLDLDDFKSINDEHGHHIGDRALVEFAAALSTVVRSQSDIVTRIGGDEFVVFLHELEDPVRQVQVVVDRLKDELEQPISLEGIPTHLHFTAGVAVSHDPVDLEELLVEADLALLDAKERGRDVAQFFRRRLGRRMMHELSTALGSGELCCSFQPQIDMETGAVVGLEALARWERDDRRQVPTRSLIDALDWLGASREWLHVAMRDIAAAWRVAGPEFEGRIWLNLMGSDLEDSCADELIDVLASTEVPLDRLGVEITDPVNRPNIGATAALLRTMKKAGVSVALDDVGDDRVPLLHMTELPVDVVKLDRCLVHGIESQNELRAVVQSLVEMCRRLDRRILAEGIETVEEKTVLRHLGIRYVQGFLFSRPLPISALGVFLEAPTSELSAGGAA